MTFPYVTRMTHEIHFAWQVQYLVKLEGDIDSLRALEMDASQVRRINHDIHFAWQAQYLVKLERHFSWQVQHFVTFWEIAGARNVAFFHRKCVSKMGRVRSPKRRVRDDDFLFGLPSDYRRIIAESSFYWRKHFREFPLTS